MRKTEFDSLEVKPDIIIIIKKDKKSQSSLFSNSNDSNDEEDEESPIVSKPLNLKYGDYHYRLDSVVLRDINKNHFSAYITLN